MATSTAFPLAPAPSRPADAPPARRRRSRPAALVAAAVVVAGAALLATVPGDTPSGEQAAAPGLAAAPSFSLPAVRAGGTTVSFSPGRPTVVNFFASWCEPCREELPLLEQASRHLAGTVDVVGVDVGDSRTAAVRLLNQTGVTFPAGFDPDRKVASSYRLQGMPTTVFVDERGRVTDVVRGRFDGAELDRYLDRLARARVGEAGAA
jgi:cytochrome c biogenesis protein CcmG/thiol:disulfide interchange protein DsbE